MYTLALLLPGPYPGISLQSTILGKRMNEGKEKERKEGIKGGHSDQLGMHAIERCFKFVSSLK